MKEAQAVGLLQAASPKTKKITVPGCGSPANGTAKPVAGLTSNRDGDGDNGKPEPPKQPGYKVVNGKTVAVADGG